MCADEGIPSVDRIARLGETLEVMEQRSEEGRDIFAVQRGLSTNEDVLHSVNSVVGNVGLSDLRWILLNHGRIQIPFELSTDYDGIFEHTGFSRRSDRPLTWQHQLPPPPSRAKAIREWLDFCWHDPEPFDDIYAPQDTAAFESLIQNDLPERLDLHDWISRSMFELVTGQHHAEFHLWQPSNGNGLPRVIKLDSPEGQFRDCLPFLGKAESGRLIWVAKDGWPLPCTDEIRDMYDNIELSLRRIELALIALARRLARHVAFRIVHDYAIPEAERQKRPILDRTQIGRATREILGGAWFDLPFDPDGELRKWSEDHVLQPEEKLTDDCIFLGDEIEDFDEDDDDDPEVDEIGNDNFTTSSPLSPSRQRY